MAPLSSAPRRAWLAGLAFALAIACAAPRPALAAVPDPEIEALARELQEAMRAETFTLRNGMQVVVIPDRRMPVVTHMVWYRTGAADEPWGRSGIAHFFEHLMFKGTRDMEPGEFSKIVARNGGQDNAFTSYDYTAYFQRIAVDRLPIVMKMEADRMTGLVLTDEVIVPERAVILEERSMRVDNDPQAQLDEEIDAALFLNHPYGIPIIGWEHEMRALSRDYAIAFYEAHYTPSNAILIVAGDVAADEVRALAERTYGRIKARPVPERVRPSEPEPHAARRVEMVDARARTALIERRYLAPSYATAAPGEAEALVVLEDILGARSTSRLYKALVIDEALAATAGTWYWVDALNATRFSISALPREGVSLEALEAGIDRVIATLLSDGVSEEEVRAAKRRILSDALYAKDSQYAMTRLYGSALTTGRTLEDIEAWPVRLAGVTPEAVMEAARKVLVPNRSVTGTLRPAPAEEARP